MSNRHIICVVVEGLRAGALGTYGNTISATPNLDALASRSVVANGLISDSSTVQGFYRSVWQGCHALRPNKAEKSTLDYLKQAQVRQRLVTDAPWLISEAENLPFDEALLFDNTAQESASCIEETQLGRFFAEAIEGLHQWREDVTQTNSLMWLHSHGMFAPWDAPLGLRADLLDEEDLLEFPDFLQPPSPLRDVDDPDVMLTHRVAYAAQITVLDACIGAFVETVQEEFAGQKILLMLMGSNGFALGEHGSIGSQCNELFSEQLHLPWLMSESTNDAPLPRLTGLAQPADVGATIKAWLSEGPAEDLASESINDGISFAPSLKGEICTGRQLAVAVGENKELAARTPAWLFRRNEGSGEQLFTKPDDLWEFNNVASLCPEIVEQMQAEIAGFMQCSTSSLALPIAPRVADLVAASR